MKVDGFLGGLAHGGSRAQELEQAGYDGVVSAEVSSDPFLPLVVAAEHTRRVDLMTSIALAFSRNPMTLATVSHDLNVYSQGRFILGIGSQVRPHITRRFSMPWSHPARRMREFILAMRAIWDCWYHDAPLNFEGEFYTHTLMTPMFIPTEKNFGPPSVYLAAVGPRMAEVAGEVADGLIAHGFTTPRYLREVTLPAIEAGLARAGKDASCFQITCPVFVLTGSNEAEFLQAKESLCRQIAFYGSTPAYRPVLELHGWGALQDELHLLSKRGAWNDMGELITDEILETFAIVTEPENIAHQMHERFSGQIHRILCTFHLNDFDQHQEIIQAIQSLPSLVPSHP